MDAAKLLLEKGAETDVVNRSGESPMRQAIHRGHSTVVRLLLANGANPDSERNDGYDTYLCDAAWHDSTDIVESLLDAGADPDWVGEYAKTALDMAIYHGNLAMVRMLLESSGHTNEVTNMPWIQANQLLRAVTDGDEAGVSGILKEWRITKRFAPYLDMALWKAAPLNQKTSTRLLLAKGADIDSRFRGIPVLFAAATSPPKCIDLDERKFPLMQFLLRQGANPHVTAKSQTLLHRAACCDNPDLARILLEGGADINRGKDASPPLLAAAYYGFRDVARFLLQRGADIEITWTRFHTGKTSYSLVLSHSLLYWARKNEDWKMEQLLLDYGVKDGLESRLHQHEPGSCPNVHGTWICPHELERVEDTTDKPELLDKMKIKAILC